MKRLVLAVLLLSAPIAAWAQHPSCEDEQATVSCAEGTTLDEGTGECVPIVG
jgi:hypothetical protein